VDEVLRRELEDVASAYADEAAPDVPAVRVGMGWR
jgi:hypothetical protein